jgi:hypothetical protein
LDQNRCSFTSSEHVKSAYRSSFSSTEVLPFCYAIKSGSIVLLTSP